MIEITKPLPKHIPALTKLASNTFMDAHGLSASPEDLQDYLSRKYTEEVMAAEILSPQNNYHIVLENGYLCGFSNIAANAPCMFKPETNLCLLDRIYLDKSYYGKGIGIQLLKYNIELAKELEQLGLWLYTWTGNMRALQFYLKNGFEIIGEASFEISERHKNPNHILYISLE